MTKTVTLPHHFGDKPWLGFEHVTMVPMCHKLLSVDLLTPDEKDWLNMYHTEVWGKTKGFFEEKGDERTLKWLRRETKRV